MWPVGQDLQTLDLELRIRLLLSTCSKMCLLSQNFAHMPFLFKLPNWEKLSLQLFILQNAETFAVLLKITKVYRQIPIYIIPCSASYSVHLPCILHHQCILQNTGYMEHLRIVFLIQQGYSTHIERLHSWITLSDLFSYI